MSASLARMAEPAAHLSLARRPPRLLFVITTSDVGGTETALRELVLGLDRQQFEPIVCSLCPGGTVARAIEAVGVPVHTLGMADPPRLRELLPAALHLARLIDAQQIDLVQALLYRANTLAGLAARLSRRRPPMVAGQRSLTPLRGRPAALAARATRRLAACTVAVSEAVRDELIAGEGVEPRRVVVIRNGVDTERFAALDRAAARAALGVAADAFVVGGVGRLSPEKGFHHLLDAASLAARDGVRLQLLLAGDGAQRAALQQQAADLGLAATVRFLGTCTDPAPVYAAADVFALPSQEEGLPNALLEAMAAGRAVVATAVGGVPSLIEDQRNGLLVAPRAPAALAAAIGRLAADAALREKLGQAARRFVVQHCSLAAMVAAHARLYRELLEPAR